MRLATHVSEEGSSDSPIMPSNSFFELSLRDIVYERVMTKILLMFGLCLSCFATLFFMPSVSAVVVSLLPGEGGCFREAGIQVKKFVPEFQHPTLHGAGYSAAQLEGQWSLLMFGYLGCDEVCHTQALVLRQLMHSPDLPDHLNFLYVSMDPTRDQARLDAYFPESASNLHVILPNSLTAAQALALELGAPFSVPIATKTIGAAEEPVSGYINHPGYLLLIDPSRFVRMIYPSYMVQPDMLRRDLANLNRQQTTNENGPICT